VTEIVFYKPARLDAGKLSIATSGPCAVVIRKSGIYLSDPTQKELAVTLIINGEPLPVNLPQGDLAGSTVKAGPP